MDTFLLVLAALFPIVNPPGSAFVFLSMTQHAPAEVRRALARRVSINSFFVMAASLLLGALVLKIYGISVPVLRVAGGLIVAVSGWKLLNEGSHKTADGVPPQEQIADYASQAFYPLTLPLTTGPGTIAVMISLGLSKSAYSNYAQEIQFIVTALLAAVVIALAVFVCFAYADSLKRVLGRGGTDIAVRLLPFGPDRQARIESRNRTLAFLASLCPEL